MADIKHSIPIAARREAIYPLVATANGFRQWWAADVTEPPGLIELGFFKRSTIYRVRLKIDNAPALAEWVCESGDEWNGTRLRFQFDTADSGTQLRFAHAGWRSETDYFVACNTTWGELMYRIKAVAEGKSPGPLFLADAFAY